MLRCGSSNQTFALYPKWLDPTQSLAFQFINIQDRDLFSRNSKNAFLLHLFKGLRHPLSGRADDGCNLFVGYGSVDDDLAHLMSPVGISKDQ